MPTDPIVASVVERFHSVLIPQSVQYLIAISPIVLMVLMAVIFWDLWVDYVRGKNYLGVKRVVLELRLPKETFKSPKAMELVLNALHNGSEGTYFKRFWKGETRPWYTLEIASIEGVIKFYIWTKDGRKQGVMSALYSQFPDMEVTEVEDYAMAVHFDPKEIRIWAAEFKLTNDPFPLKTYVDYGLDKDPKEEFKVDPMLPLLEFLGSVGPNQQVWMQIPIQAHIEERLKGHILKKGDPWKESITKKKNEILLIKDPKTKVAGEINEETGYSKMPMISEAEREVVLALERRLSKAAFDCGIRFLYISKKDIFSTPFGIGGVISSMNQFRHEHMNGFKPNGDKWHPRLGDPWLDYKDMRRNRYGKGALAAYKRRSFFYPPFKSKPLVLNVEELATIYHFPGSVSKTPNLDRVPSKKSQAPGNLPI